MAQSNFFITLAEVKNAKVTIPAGNVLALNQISLSLDAESSSNSSTKLFVKVDTSESAEFTLIAILSEANPNRCHSLVFTDPCTFRVDGPGRLSLLGLVTAGALNSGCHDDECHDDHDVDFLSVEAVENPFSKIKPAQSVVVAVTSAKAEQNAAKTTAKKVEVKKTEIAKPEQKKPATAAAPAAPAAVPAVGTKVALGGGLVYTVTKQPTNSKVKAISGDKIKVRYAGRLASNGKQFDKGVIEFRVGRGEVIQGWDKGLLGAAVGEGRTILIPSRLGYGSRGAPPSIPGNADLVFETEIVAIGGGKK
jgi:FKBP-type peptidyl-prolyl cis-trans isomerase